MSALSIASLAGAPLAPRVATGSSGARAVYANEGMRVEIRTGRRTAGGEIVRLAPSEVAIAVATPTENLRAGARVEVLWAPFGVAPFASRGTVSSSVPAMRSQRSVHEVTIAFDACPPRSREEHTLGELSWLTAYASDPFFFREWLHFKINAIGPRSLRAIVPSRARSLVPGLPLELTVCVPVVGQVALRAHVTGVSPEARPGETDVALTLDDPPSGALDALSEHLLAARDDVTLASLRAEGFAAHGLHRVMTCGYVENDDDMRQVLELRLAAYHSKNKFAFAKSADDMLDPFDAFSRQIVCRVGSRIVGAVRLVYVQRERARSEEVELGAPLPDWLFAEPFAEISRLCSHPEFRGSDVLVAILQQVGRVAVSSGLPRLVASCDDQCALYEKLGFKKLGIQYDAYGRKGIDVICAEMQDFVDGRGMSPLVYGHVQAPMVAFLARRGVVRPRGLGRARAAVYRTFQKTIERVSRAAMERGREKKKQGKCCDGCGKSEKKEASS